MSPSIATSSGSRFGYAVPHRGMSACPSFGLAMTLLVAAAYCASVSNGRYEDLIDKFRQVC